MSITIRIEVPREYHVRWIPTPLARAINWQTRGYRLVAWEADAAAEILAAHLKAYIVHEDIFTRRTFVNRWGSFMDAWERFYMPTRRKQQETPRSETPFATKGFLDRRLSEGELAELDNWKPKPVEIFDHMAGMTHEGLKITLTYKQDTGSGICTLTDNRENSPTNAYALSSFDADCLQALKMAIFKHTAILQGDWSSLLDAPAVSRRG